MKIEDIKDPDKGTAMAAWTPAQQYMPDNSRREKWGFMGRLGAVVMADELGDKLSELGRANVVMRCFGYGKEDASAALTWSICGPDVKALDMKKLAAELDAEHVSADSKDEVIRNVTDSLEKAKKIGAAVEAAAKDDPGVAQVLKLADQGKAEWQKYLAKNQPAFTKFLELMDAVRSGKTNHKNFQGCWEATQPAFAKLVKATKFPFEADRDLVPTYVSTMLTNTESFITVASFAACAYSVHESGEALADAALNGMHGGTIRVGWRTAAIALALDPKLKPKFADRSLSWGEFGMPRDFTSDTLNTPSVKTFLSIMTPNQGVVSKVTKDGDTIKISFKGDTVDACLQWVETRKVTGYAANGDPMYERVCKKRGKVANQESDTVVAAKFAAGIAPGVSTLTVNGYPATVWKGKKFVSVLGFPNSK